MMTTTLTALKAILAADESVAPDVREAILAAARGKAEKPVATDEGLRRGQVATLLHIHPQTVSRYVRAGLIRPLRAGAGRVRATLYSRRSVEAFLAGKAGGAE